MIEVIKNSYSSYASYLWDQITLSSGDGIWGNYFWLLVIVSAIFLRCERV